MLNKYIKRKVEESIESKKKGIIIEFLESNIKDFEHILYIKETMGKRLGLDLYEDFDEKLESYRIQIETCKLLLSKAEQFS